METAEHREPYESRGSRTDLGAPRGESPLGDSTSSPIRRVVGHRLQSAESGQPSARSQTPGFDPKPSLTGTEQPRGQIEFSLTWLLCMPRATHHLGAANYAMVGQALLGVDMRAT